MIVRQPGSGLCLKRRFGAIALLLAASVALSACGGNDLFPILNEEPPQQAESPPTDLDVPARAALEFPRAAETAPPPPFLQFDPAAPVPVPPQPTQPTPPAGAETAALPGLSLRPPVLTEDGPVRVAILLPLTGANAPVGQAMLNAALMALFDVGDERLILVPKDTEGLPEGAIDAVERAVAAGAEIVLGPLFSASVQAAAQVTRRHDINMIAFSTDRGVAGSGVYLIGFTPEQQVERVVSFAASRGLQRFAVLAPDNAYGATVVRALQETVARTGTELARVEMYSGGPDEFFGPVQRLASYEQRQGELAAMRERLRARDDEVSQRTLARLEGLETIGEVGFDAVLLAEGGDRLRALAPLLPFYDIDPDRVRFLGTGLWDEAGLGREPALVGGWFAGTARDTGNAFRERYAQTYGDPPPRIASLAYDAAALAAVLARTRTRPYYDTEALTNPSGFAGIDGIFRFRPDGIAERGLAVLEVTPDGPRVVSPAPQTFQDLVN